MYFNCNNYSKYLFLLVVFFASNQAYSDSKIKKPLIFNQLEKKIEDNDYKKITSVLVSHKGSLIYENYFNEGGPEFKNDVRSASKSITAILYGIAIDEGLFESEKDKVISVFLDKQPIKNLTEKKQNMTFEDLMMMNPPMECNDWNPASAGNEERMYLLEDWEQFILDLPNRGTPPWELPPEKRRYGKAFSYCTGGAFLTGSAIARKAGQGLDSFAQRKLFEPLGIKDVTWPYSPLGIAQGGGGVKMNSRSYVKIGQLMLNKGTVRGSNSNLRVVSKNWVDKMLTPRIVARADMEFDYGYLWWVKPFKYNGGRVRTFAAAGNGGNYLFVVPELDLVALVTSTAFNTSYMHKQTLEIFESFILKGIN